MWVLQGGFYSVSWKFVMGLIGFIIFPDPGGFGTHGSISMKFHNVESQIYSLGVLLSWVLMGLEL